MTSIQYKSVKTISNAGPRCQQANTTENDHKDDHNVSKQCQIPSFSQNTVQKVEN